MKITTRDFGEVEVNPQELVRFIQPIFGFEDEQEYVLLSDDSFGDSLLWLQSVKSSNVCFILVDPAVLPNPYLPHLPAQLLEQLELSDAGQAVVRVIAVVHEDFAKSTVNLKSPIVINCEKRLAAQVMLEENYPIRARLLGGEEETVC